MSLKSKPKLVPMTLGVAILPPENIEWAKSADALPDAISEAPQNAIAAPVPQAAEETPPVVSGNKPIIEGKTNVSLRLAPSVQIRLKDLAYLQMKRSGGERVTLQDLLEKAVMDMLKREEAKFK